MYWEDILLELRCEPMFYAVGRNMYSVGRHMAFTIHNPEGIKTMMMKALRLYPV